MDEELTHSRLSQPWHQQLWCVTMTLQWARWCLKSTASRLLTPSFIQAQMNENFKVPRHWPLWGEFTGHRWIPLHKGTVTRKCFHLMTSSLRLKFTPHRVLLVWWYIRNTMKTWFCSYAAHFVFHKIILASHRETGNANTYTTLPLSYTTINILVARYVTSMVCLLFISYIHVLITTCVTLPNNWTFKQRSIYSIESDCEHL